MYWQIITIQRSLLSSKFYVSDIDSWMNIIDISNFMANSFNAFYLNVWCYIVIIIVIIIYWRAVSWDRPELKLSSMQKHLVRAILSNTQICHSHLKAYFILYFQVKIDIRMSRGWNQINRSTVKKQKLTFFFQKCNLFKNEK